VVIDGFYQTGGLYTLRGCDHSQPVKTSVLSSFFYSQNGFSMILTELILEQGKRQRCPVFVLESPVLITITNAKQQIKSESLKGLERSQRQKDGGVKA
jgi:hypothetical protein